MAWRYRMAKDAAREFVDVCIIGSGISGLTAARHLKSAGLTFTVLEKATRIGGIWAGRGTYECLRLQQHKSAFYLDGCPWPESTPDYPTVEDLRVLINKFADVHSLRSHIRLRSPVSSVVYDPERNVWVTTYGYGDKILASSSHPRLSSPQVENSTKEKQHLLNGDKGGASGDSSPIQTTVAHPAAAPDQQVSAESYTVIESRYIAFAGGCLGEPTVPESLSLALQGFGGNVLHSSSFYRPLMYTGRHVLVVGFGASSVEIAADLANRGSCASVTLLAPPKRTAGGMPYEDWCLSRDLDREATKFFCANPREPHVTVAERNSAVRAAMQTRHQAALDALPAELKPAGNPLDGRIIVSEAFNDAVAQGRVRVVAGTVQAATDDTVLVDNAAKDVLRADDIILCTGYAPPLPRIQAIVKPAPSSMEMFQTMWSPQVRNAAFLGFGYGFVAISKLAEVQARLLAAVASNQLTLASPDEMRAWIAANGPSNILRTTQCLTDNKYFAQLTAPLDALEAAAMRALEVSTQLNFNVAPVSPVLRIQARAYSVVRSDIEQSDSAGLSAVGDDLNAVAFKSDDPYATYSKWAEDYDRDSFDVLKFDSPYSCRDHILAYWPENIGNARIQLLDVGCGTGAIARLVSDALGESDRANVDFHGIDLTQQMLNVAQRLGYYDTLRQWSVSNLPWPVHDDSKDMAACNGVLIYVPPDVNVLNEFIRVVKPGGHIVLMFRNDNISDWQPHIDFLERNGKWKLVEVSESRDNFPGSPKADEKPVMYRM